MMSNNKIELLIERAKIFSEGGKWILTEEIIQNVEASLGVVLPDDFRELCKICRYDIIGGFQFYNFGRNEVIETTKYWREQENLPHEYIVLSSDDASFELIKTISDKECRVIICDYQDFFNLCERGNFMYETTTFKSFTDFYEFLLTEEESYRAESKK
jgi:hypothetical protein